METWIASALMLALLCVRTDCVCFYIRCPQSGEGVLLLLSVLAEFPGDFSGLRQLLRQVGPDVVWQLLARSGQRRPLKLEKRNLSKDEKFKQKGLKGGDMKKKVRWYLFDP